VTNLTDGILVQECIKWLKNLLYHENFMPDRWEAYLKTTYVLIIWEYLGTKLCCLCRWENFVRWDVFSGFHCNSELLNTLRTLFCPLYIHDTWVAGGILQTSMYLRLTFKHFSHHGTKVCIPVQNKFSGTVGRSCKLISCWHLQQVACQPGAT